MFGYHVQAGKGILVKMADHIQNRLVVRLLPERNLNFYVSLLAGYNRRIKDIKHVLLGAIKPFSLGLVAP